MALRLSAESMQSAEISKSALNDALNGILAASMRPVCVGMALLYALLTAWYLLQYDGTAQTNMGLSTGLLSLALVVGAIWFERNQLPARYAHPVAALIAIPIVLHCLFLLVSVPEARHTTNLMITLLGLGCLLLSVRWFAALALLSLLGWLWLASTHLTQVDWRHFGLALVEATFFGALVLWVRIRAYRNIQGLRLRDHMLVDELRTASEAALAATRVKSEFLANMSHELRTPMTAMLGMTELLLMTGLDNDQREFASTIERAGNTLLKLVNDILDFSKIEAGHMQLEEAGVELEVLLGEVRDLLEVKAQEKGLALLLDISPNLPRLRGDPTRIGRILINLVGNAIKFTHEGHVKLIARATPLRDDTVLVKLAVEDTGIGIAQDALQRVFEVFTQADASTTRRYGGTGLGLAISRRLTELMGGKVEVESEVGRGSTFTVSIPLSVAQRRTTTPPAPSNEPLCRFEGRILLVEDQGELPSAGGEMLRRLGCEVEQVRDCAEALACMAQASFDLVLLDCELPEQSRNEMTREIRKLDASRGKQTRLVALTDSALPDDRERCTQAGMDDVLAKPFTRHELQPLLGRWLHV